ncbi:ATP-binding protein [Streptomyces sp. CYG20]|nr:ATP-binding protein [Streptomyces sp. COG21]MBT3081236.1 ATP-binding protein [Streptomyces sp. COG20]MBT3089889.1 ATP-binding protein [Streptomyces sp. CYG21]MBT3097629.1 ATP-binding protein [Streptomyces sp. CBG30]MBT3102822.1 ATP-binding protein [Streptomyces sp. COG19]MBT3112937.1 ATP-binding protein [Streptomyces sp. CYG20]
MQLLHKACRPRTRAGPRTTPDGFLVEPNSTGRLPVKPHCFSFPVPRTACAVSDARHRVVAAVHGWGFPAEGDTAETLALLAGELLTNAVQHAGRGPISVTVRLTDDKVRIEVCDASSVRPKAVLPGPDDEHGRGLFIVAALAVGHGVETTASGKRCWAEIPAHTHPPRPDAAVHMLLPRR